MLGKWDNKCYKGIPIGLSVRKQLAKEFIYRVHRANGQYGTVKGALYQHKYKYFVPPNIRNVEGEPARTAFALAVRWWQNFVPQEMKDEYNRICKNKPLSGYNLFIREFVKQSLT
jgi:hypothetical protein